VGKKNIMDQAAVTVKDKTCWRDWLIVVALAAGFFLWGIFIFFAVGVKWPPSWNFGVVADVPGLSEYSTAGQRSLPTVASPFLHEEAQLTPQHVMERPQPLSDKAGEKKP
jgi:hypothetical protein